MKNIKSKEEEEKEILPPTKGNVRGQHSDGNF